MKRQKQLSRVLSLVLTLSMILGMLPTVAFAAQKGEVPGIIEYKAMTLVNLQGGQWLSRYDYAQADNTFYEDAAVNLNIPSLLRIGFTIEKSQNVDLVLYKLKESAVQKIENDDDHAHLDYYFDPEAPDFGASVPEEFLGEKIGYINGIHITDNIVDPDEDAEFVEYNRLTDEEWDEIIWEALRGERPAQSMRNIYAFGFKGEKLILPAAAAEAAMVMSLDDETSMAENEITSPASMGYSISSDTSILNAEISGTEDIADDSAAVENEPSESDAIGDAAPSPVETEEIVEPGPTAEPISMLPISDVLYDPNPVSTFSGQRAPRAGAEWAIENYVLWDGTVVKGGEVVQPDYEDGYYVIVMQPCMPEAAVYNSFLGFKSTTKLKNNNAMDAFLEALGQYFEVPDITELINNRAYKGLFELIEYLTKDPVNLISGSFSWNYTDMALYGKDNLEFARYYESTSADKNFGLGNGWTSNFTADLTVKKFYAEVHLAQNRTLFFVMDYDGEYRACGDWIFAWNGNGYTLENPITNTVYNFNEDEVLESISSLGKSTLIFTNDGEKITSVTNGVDTFTPMPRAIPSPIPTTAMAMSSPTPTATATPPSTSMTVWTAPWAGSTQRATPPPWSMMPMAGPSAIPMRRALSLSTLTTTMAV